MQWGSNSPPYHALLPMSRCLSLQDSLVHTAQFKEAPRLSRTSRSGRSAWCRLGAIKATTLERDLFQTARKSAEEFHIGVNRLTSSRPRFLPSSSPSRCLSLCLRLESPLCRFSLSRECSRSSRSLAMVAQRRYEALIWLTRSLAWPLWVPLRRWTAQGVLGTFWPGHPLRERTGTLSPVKSGVHL